MSSAAPAAQLDKEITPSELEVAKGGKGQALWVALYVAEHGKVCVFDVSSGASFYGPGGGYSVFAGKDASRALATMKLDETSTDISGLTDEQKTTLDGWAKKYLSKYPIVGVLKSNL